MPHVTAVDKKLAFESEERLSFRLAGIARVT